jgi:hypothetical protein
MPVFSEIKQTAELPLTDISLLCITFADIIFSYDNVEDYVKNLNQDSKNELLLSHAFKESISQPRFNLDSYFYKNIVVNKQISILPDFKTNLDTTELFDLRAQELFEASKNYNNTYIFWSGGIDSTLILCSVLKNWPSLKNLVVVLNQNSIDENTTMYENYIRNKLTIVNTDLFLDKTVKFSHEHLYVSGDFGDPLITFDGYREFKNQYPVILDKSWKTNLQKIIEYFNSNQRFNSGKHAVTQVIKSFGKLKIQPRTVHDFLWWVNFNWGWNTELYAFLWSYHDIDYDLDIKKFIENNMFYYFNSVECQNWAISLIGTAQTNYNNISKYPFKQYIFDFNKDIDYFKYKEKEFSGIKNKKMLNNKKIMAVDEHFNLYYRQNYKIVPYY